MNKCFIRFLKDISSNNKDQYGILLLIFKNIPGGRLVLGYCSLASKMVEKENDSKPEREREIEGAREREQERERFASESKSESETVREGERETKTNT